MIGRDDHKEMEAAGSAAAYVGRTTMAERLEMAIPRWSADSIFSIVSFTIAVFATFVAVLNLFFQVAIVVSCIWLAFMASSIWGMCKDQGGSRKCLINFLGFFARRQFVESICQDRECEIRFGYQLFGRCLFYFKVPFGKIESVEWSAGQNPAFWDVCIWFDHDDPQKSLTRKTWSQKPDQDIYRVGPSRCKKETAAFGLDFVDFLCRAGVTMVRGKDDCTFVRATSGTTTEPQ